MDPTCLSVVNMYIKMTSGIKRVAVVVKNLMTTLIITAKGFKVTQVVAVNVVPQVEVTTNTMEKLDEIQGIQQT